ncbi:MAG: FMN-binding protein [Defluviitaleaceae bacterium]|nr:FMN-binding protein [Defluviitaleaceae bacterium]MCL2837033.1 FMN-binding protein [Defluviitaleaceae bacterium]
MGIVKTGFRLFIITLTAAAALGAVNYITEPMIDENVREAREAAMEEVLTGIDDPGFSKEFTTGNRYGVVSYYIATKGSSPNPVGYVVYVDRQGDQGGITVCVGLDAGGVILGVKLVSHEETPGLGANAARPAFLSQFTGREGPFNVVKTRSANPRDIVAVTAATNTSRAVSGAVNDAWVFYHEYLSWNPGKGVGEP